MPAKQVPLAPMNVVQNVRDELAKGTVKGTNKAVSQIINLPKEVQKTVLKEVAQEGNINKTEHQRAMKMLDESVLGKRTKRTNGGGRKQTKKNKRKITRRR